MLYKKLQQIQVAYSELVRATASGTVDSGLILIKLITKKWIITASLLDAEHCVENKPASLIVVPLGKALSRISTF